MKFFYKSRNKSNNKKEKCVKIPLICIHCNATVKKFSRSNTPETPCFQPVGEHPFCQDSVQNNLVQLRSNFCVKIATQIMNCNTICSN